LSKVVVVGGIDMDITISVERHPRPGEEISGWDLTFLPGGKGANQAVAAARAGAEVRMIGHVGHDPFGDQLITFLKGESVDVTGVERVSERATGMAFITIDRNGENTIVYDGTLLPSLSFGNPELIDPGDVLVSQFEVPVRTVVEFFTEGRRKGTLNIFNAAPPHPVGPDLMRLIDVLIVNEFELAALTGRPSVDPADRAQVERALELLSPPDGKAVIVTLGAHGAVVADEHGTSWIQARPVRAVDTTGAGDAFVGALSAALAMGRPLHEAARYANVSASIAVTRKGGGPAMPLREEVERVY